MTCPCCTIIGQCAKCGRSLNNGHNCDAPELRLTAEQQQLLDSIVTAAYSKVRKADEAKS